MQLNTVYNENCLDTMLRMPENFVDMVLTSPPYDNLRNYNGYSFDFEPIANELYRITKNGGIVVWIVGDATINGSETGVSFRQALYFKEIGFKLHDTMIFQKKNPHIPQSIRYKQSFEYMFVLSKGTPKTTNIIKDRENKTSGKPVTGTSRKRNGSLKDSHGKTTGKVTPQYSIRDNIWSYYVGYMHTYKDKYLRGHPAAFPELLAQDHILSWSNPGDIVYDPFMGSGTTAKMCILNDRNFVGSEISTEYWNICNRRIKDAEFSKNNNGLFDMIT